MRVTSLHSTAVLWVFVFCWPAARAQSNLPPGAVALINQDRYGSRIALCADTGEPAVQHGARKVRGTAVWAGEDGNLTRIHAGVGACDPSWSPDGRRLAVTAADGLWVFPADSTDGTLRVESRLPIGSIEFNYRAFSNPEWSPDGMLLGLVVTNLGTSWVEVFEVSSGRLFYTSPPANDTFTWTAARELKLGTLEIRLSRR